MMKMRKTRVTLALGAVLGAAALAPATSFAWSVDTANGNLVTSSGGDTLLFPIYTTSQGASTSFSVTNTSAQTVLAKIRFREQVRSMDVLDFFAILSPYDKFDFWVEQGEPRPFMGWNDNTCVVGPGTSKKVQFPGPSDYVDSDDDMKLGHLEVLGVADLTDVCVTSGGEAAACDAAGAIDLDAAALHGADGVPANCGIFTTVFGSPSNVGTLNASSLGADVDNVLVGRYVVTGTGVGIEGGSDAVGIRDSDLGPPALPITAQSGANCVNCTVNYAWDQYEWDHPHLAEMGNLAGFQDALTSDTITGDWSNNPDNFVGVDWVLSFPSKYAYLDVIDAGSCTGGATSGSEWCLLPDTQTTNGNSGIWTATSTANLCLVGNDLAVWDTEEAQASGSVSVSPGSQTSLDVCNEMQVFTLAAQGQQVRDSVIQESNRRGVITFENLDAVRGWGSLDLSWATTGDAITGILFTTRATEDPEVNNGSITTMQKF